MAKIKKTKSDKKIADLRRQLTATKPLTQETSTKEKTYTFTSTTHVVSAKSFKPTTTYPYILADLKKTAVLSIIAIVSQIVIYFILRSVS